MSRVAVVTGSRRGIGLAILEGLLREGYTGIMSGVTADGEEALAPLRAQGYRVAYVPCDISRTKDRAELLARVHALHGRLDVLVNNAGVAPALRMDVLETTEESFDRVLDVNLRGTFFLCQAAAQYMLAGQSQALENYSPRIVNVSSVSAYTASVNRGEYCISKAGISMVTKLFADRLAEYGIPVFEVRPGIILTDMTRPVQGKYADMIAAGVTPIRRFGTPEDVADCVLAAVSGRLDFATGQVLNPDGGFHIRRL
jgi:Dehydrogenases with different specificities (related to short-chain alcohol dehydrogenases)